MENCFLPVRNKERASTFLSIIDKSKIDISNGIYCPMAGFGGIVRGAEEWFKNHKKEPKIEAYDINPIFCNYFGWIQKDVLSDYVKTDKTVLQVNRRQKSCKKKQYCR